MRNNFKVICPCGFVIEDFMFVEDHAKSDSTLWEAWCLKCMRGISVAISEEDILPDAAPIA